MLLRNIKCYHITSHQIMQIQCTIHPYSYTHTTLTPCHAMPCHAMPCHAMPCHAMPCHAMPCHANVTDSPSKAFISHSTALSHSLTAHVICFSSFHFTYYRYALSILSQYVLFLYVCTIMCTCIFTSTF